MDPEETQETTSTESLNPMDNFDYRTPAEVEADAAAAVEEPEEETVEEPETPEEEPSKEEETPSEEAPKYQPPQKVTLQAPTFEEEIPLDEYGNIDGAKFGEYLQKRDNYVKEMARVEANNAYYNNTFVQREWADVESKHGDLIKANPDVRGMIDAMRQSDAISGGNGVLMEAADKVASMIGTTRADATRKAQSTVTRQKSVSLSPSTRTQNANASTTQSLRKAALGGGPNSQAARIAYIASLYESGALGN